MKLVRVLSFIFLCLAFFATRPVTVEACAAEDQVMGFGSSASAANSDCVANAENLCAAACNLYCQGAPFDVVDDCYHAEYLGGGAWQSEGGCGCHEEPK